MQYSCRPNASAANQRCYSILTAYQFNMSNPKADEEQQQALLPKYEAPPKKDKVKTAMIITYYALCSSLMLVVNKVRLTVSTRAVVQFRASLHKYPLERAQGSLTTIRAEEQLDMLRFRALSTSTMTWLVFTLPPALARIPPGGHHKCIASAHARANRAAPSRGGSGAERRRARLDQG